LSYGEKHGNKKTQIDSHCDKRERDTRKTKKGNEKPKNRLSLFSLWIFALRGRPASVLKFGNPDSHSHVF
jgi:hypothetical protein